MRYLLQFLVSLSFISLLAASLSKSEPNSDTVCQFNLNPIKSPRFIVIGDIHGAYDMLQDILVVAKISTKDAPCEWHSGTTDTILVQVGDMVDRGLYSLECAYCLERLQRTAPKDSKVIRLIGNHDIWWLEGVYDYTEE